MKGIYRILIAVILLMAAIASYSFGIQSGVFLFVVLGFILEGLFWLGLFPTKRQKKLNPS
ncbi:hypothetical protein BK026_05510 [Alteromonas sp. V450]|nr:hypothetical protein BK026_05510 [Alteromonas sp. V450]